MKAIDLPNGAIVVERSDFKKTWKERKGLAKIRCFLPPLIRFFTGGYYNHAFIVGDIVIYDPDYPRCITRPLSWANEKEVEVWIPNHYTALVFSTIEGKAYGLIDILFYQLIYQLTFRRVWLGRRKGKATEKIICSEGVCLPYNYACGLFPFSFRMDTEQLRQELNGKFTCIFVGKLD